MQQYFDCRFRISSHCGSFVFISVGFIFSRETFLCFIENGFHFVNSTAVLQ